MQDAPGEESVLVETPKLDTLVRNVLRTPYLGKGGFGRAEYLLLREWLEIRYAQILDVHGTWDLDEGEDTLVM